MLCETNTHRPAQPAQNDTQPSHGAHERLVLTPRADVREDANAFLLLADLPGVALAGVNISLEKNLLTIEGSQTTANDDGYELHYTEYEPCNFRRIFRVDSPIERDKITARMQNGVLQVTLPKAAPAKVSKIDVAVT